MILVAIYAIPSAWCAYQWSVGAPMPSASWVWAGLAAAFAANADHQLTNLRKKK